MTIAALCLWIAFRRADFTELGSRLSDTSMPLLALAFLLSILGNSIKATKLGVLLRRMRPIPYRVLFAAEMVSILVDVVFPLRLQEMVRAYIVGRGSGIAASYVLGTELVEKSLELVCALGVVILFCLRFPLPPSLAWPVWSGIALVSGLLVFGLAVLSHPRVGVATDRLLGRWPRLWMGRPRRLLLTLVEAVGQTMVRPRVLVAVAGITVIEWVFLAATVYVAALASGVELSPVALTGLLIANFAAFAVPSSTSGSVGIYEAAGVGVLVAWFGFPREQALATVLTMHFVMLASGSLAGLAGLRIVHLSLASVRDSASRTPARVPIDASCPKSRKANRLDPTKPKRY